jgi:hypothetical protein
MAIKKGDTVRLIQPEIKGEVKERVIGDDDSTRLRVEWTEPDGTVTSRWFDETQLEQA